jgi:hypothetical protein
MRPDEETLVFLETSYENIPPEGQAKIRQSFDCDSEDKIEHTVCVLVAHESLRRLGLSPCFEPSVGEKTPDLKFLVSEQIFLADVFVRHIPTRTFWQEDNDEYIKDDGTAAEYIHGDLMKKAWKYAKLGYPLVVFVFFGDQFLRPLNLLQALFDEYYELDPDGRPRKIRWGIYWEETSDTAKQVREALSAVVACNWFRPVDKQYTGKQYTGRRLHYLVVHNCRASVRLPVMAFQKFTQFICTNGDFESMEWLCPSIVANFPAQGGIEFEVY